MLIALDGENAWEHYPFNGYYFLRALYALLGLASAAGADARSRIASRAASSPSR